MKINTLLRMVFIIFYSPVTMVAFGFMPCKNPVFEIALAGITWCAGLIWIHFLYGEVDYSQAGDL